MSQQITLPNRTALKFPQVQCGLATSDILKPVAEAILNAPVQHFGFDAEAEGLLFPTHRTAGFSLYFEPSPQQGVALYLPFNHYTVHEDGSKEAHSYNLNPTEVAETLYPIFTSKHGIAHNATFDFQHLIKLFSDAGYSRRDMQKLNAPMCTLVTATMLQSHNNALKHLGMEYGLTSYKDVIDLESVLASQGRFNADDAQTLKLSPEQYNFCLVNMVESTSALAYTGQDSFLAYGLLPLLHGILLEYVYDNNPASLDFSLEQQFASIKALATSTAYGYPVSEPSLVQAINYLGRNLIASEENIKNQIRDIMGWSRV